MMTDEKRIQMEAVANENTLCDENNDDSENENLDKSFPHM